MTSLCSNCCAFVEAVWPARGVSRSEEMRTFDVAGLMETLLLRSGDVELNPGPSTIGPLDPSHTSTVENELVCVASKWKELGAALSLSSVWLKELSQQDKDPLSCLHNVVERWLLSGDLSPSWASIVKALEKLGEEVLSKKLSSKYISKELPLSENPSRIVVRLQRPPLEGCGFKNCNACSYVIDTYRSMMTPDLPYLVPGWYRNGEERRERLLLEHKEMLHAFQDLLSTAWRALVRKGMTTDRLVAHLESLGGVITDKHQVEQIPVFSRVIEQFKENQSLEEVFMDLRDYYSYFNYHLIRNLLNSFCPSMEGQRILKQYEEKFRFFTQHKTVEAPSLLLIPNPHGHAYITVRMDRDPRRVSLMDVDLYRQRMSILLRLKEFSLRVIYVKTMEDGRMETVYQFPQWLRSKVFPLSEQKESQLREDGIIYFGCCDYIFTAPPSNYEAKLIEALYGVPTLPEDPNEEIFPLPPFEGVTNEALLKKMMAVLSETDFKMALDQDSVTAGQLALARLGMEKKNTISIVRDARDGLVVFALILGQHIYLMKNAQKLARIVVVASTKPRCEALHKELSALFPKASIGLFTGTEKESISTKLDSLQHNVLVCTAGKLFRDYQSRTLLDAISLLLMEDFNNTMLNTSLRDAAHIYLAAKINYYRRKTPHMVGIMASPGDGIASLTADDMEVRLLNFAATVDGMRPPVHYPKGDFPKDTQFSVTSFNYRDPKRDFVAHLSVEMGRLENQCGLTCPFEKWSPAYSSFIQTFKDTLSSSSTLSSDPATLGHLEMLLCCSKAMAVGREFGCEDAVQVLRRHTLSSDPLMKGVENALVLLQAELQNIVTRKHTVVETVLGHLSSQFSQSPLSKGILFVDSYKEGQFLCEEIKKHLFHVRPTFVDPLYLDRDADMETDSIFIQEQDTLKNFTRGECRLLVIPFPIEEERDRLQLPSCHFILRLVTEIPSPVMVELLYTLTVISSSNQKPVPNLLADLQMKLMEVVLKKDPFSDQTENMTRRRQGNLVQDYLTQTRFPYAAPTRRKGKKVPAEKVALKCKQCRTYACRGKDIFTLFADGGQFYVVPDRNFRLRYMTKTYRSKHQTIKRITRQHRIVCRSCNSRWGSICYFPARKCAIPVIKSKYFLFDTDEKLLIVKLWPHAPFYVPPITTCDNFRSVAASPSPPSESE